MFLHSLRYLVILVSLMLTWSGHVSSKDGVRTAEPPIVEIELSGVEPLPSGVAKLMGFGSGAGGGGELPEIQNFPHWIHAPLIVYPQIPEPPRDGRYIGSIFVACGYPEGDYPEVEVTSPSGASKVVALETAADCWEYYQTWFYGMELGKYQLVAEHPNGTLTHTWEVEYTPYPLVGLISDGRTENEQTRLLMGFEPGESLSVRIYSPEIEVEVTTQEDFEIPGAFDGTIGGYVGTRIVEADENGAVILNFTTTPSAPFIAGRVGFSIDGYKNPYLIGSPAGQDYRVTRLAEQTAAEFSVAGPVNVATAAQIETIWKKLTFKDMKSPGTAKYRVSLADGRYLLRFTWCADTPERLHDNMAAFDLGISVNQIPVSAWNLLRYDEETCRTWVSILTPNAPELQIEFQYTISADIFDGTSAYAAGDYSHVIDATFQ